MNSNQKNILSIIIPCYNEEKTLVTCVERVQGIADQHLSLEIIIVDDNSQDTSFLLAQKLEKKHSNIKVLRHSKNHGKGAALRTGFAEATGDFVAVQDADLEYNPVDLKKLIVPMINGEADVVFGSRFLSTGTHRVLYFWHYLGNRFLTFLSNMFSDLNLTDMEVCYKVFRREIIQKIDIKENGFGFEPEIVAKVAQMRLRIFEMGISYYGRTFEEGKKIRMKDGFWTLYCIFRYNASRAPIPIQFFFYLFIGGIAAAVNLFIFLGMISTGLKIDFAAPIAFYIAASVNYILCIFILFRHQAQWSFFKEIFFYFLIVSLIAVVDLQITKSLINLNISASISKILASGAALLLNFLGRRFLIFSEKPPGPWKPISKNKS